MSRDSVRYGRVPKRSTLAPRRADSNQGSALSSAVASSSGSAPEPPVSTLAGGAVMFANAVAAAGLEAESPDSPSDLISPVSPPSSPNSPPSPGSAVVFASAVIAALRPQNPYTIERKISIGHHPMALIELPPEADDGYASSSTDVARDERSVLWMSLAHCITPGIHHIVEYAKRLPGFFSLPQDDQLILIKLGFFDVWISRSARLCEPYRLVFHDGQAVRDTELSIVFGDQEFVRSLHAYMRRMCSLYLTESEEGLYCALQLLNHMRPGLSARPAIARIHKLIYTALKRYTLANGGQQRLDAICTAWNHLRGISVRFHELLDWCREQAPRLILPPLFSETFDIPKREEPQPQQPEDQQPQPEDQQLQPENQQPQPSTSEIDTQNEDM